MAETGERIYEHEIHRLKGECTLAAGGPSGRKVAIGHFEHAAALATERGALLFELRATTSLCRVQRSARERLLRLVERSAPEDDCADLRAARALL